MILALAALVWLAGCCHRIYRHALFLQLEEYQSGRYLRWLAGRRSRWLPRRPLLAWLVGSALMLLPGGTPDAVLPVYLALPVALLANWPQTGAEVKKGFRVTWRARRLLVVAWALALLFASLAVVVSDAIADDPAMQPLLWTAAGSLLVLLAPLLLVSASLLLRPVEALLRRRFVVRARTILEEAGPIVIGITGSYGKTSTKVCLQHILNGQFRVGATPKSYNTLMGVCLAINQDLVEDRSLDYYVVEMGAYVPGEIAEI
ncbi:MAG: Mur ligase family protein, partial [Anaerolineaceae bacterium]|nr:Mur ligase family protein [Anaerolineaceae bacterium]